MKRSILILCTLISSILLFGQITATGTYKSYFKIYDGIDYLIVFNGINPAGSLKYTGNYNSINWYKFTNPTVSVNNQAENFNIEDGTGYILDVDGTKTTIWVIDYQQHLPVFNALTPENKPASQCDELKLNLQSNVPLLQYKSLSGKTFSIDRNFTLTYNSKEWNGEWKDQQITTKIKLPATDILIDRVPLCDTKFVIEGDQFATDLLINPLPKVESSLYQAVAVEAHLGTTTAIRTELQEGERPDNAKTLNGSAPLDIMFQSNANIPVTKFYKWQIFKDNSLLFNRTDQDQRYTFTESGTFVVKLTVSNDYCSSSDSVTVRVSTSDLQVPYAFSPNGDQLNDEFRVAYKSIVTFKCWVFNRWGHKVFFWTDPQKGWDGNINGKPAKEGAYFYVIEAMGADGIPQNRKGTIHLFRGKPQ